MPTWTPVDPNAEPWLRALRSRVKDNEYTHKLLITARGRKLAADPIALLYDLGLDLGGGDPFTAVVANVVVEALEENAP